MSLKYTFSLLFLLTMSPFGSALADFDSGLQAYTSGDYESAASEWAPLAEAGNTAAQYHLGLLYEEGQALPRDYDLARFWYLRAATGGYTDAYFALGEIYAKGRGTLPDRSLTYHWYSMAAEKGHRRAQELLPRYAPKLSHEQMIEAKRITAAWHVAHAQ